jgi:hypothetical protein
MAGFTQLKGPTAGTVHLLLVDYNGAMQILPFDLNAGRCTTGHFDYLVLSGVQLRANYKVCHSPFSLTFELCLQILEEEQYCRPLAMGNLGHEVFRANLAKFAGTFTFQYSSGCLDVLVNGCGLGDCNVYRKPNLVCFAKYSMEMENLESL